jgi:outer membrane protein TolC
MNRNVLNPTLSDRSWSNQRRLLIGVAGLVIAAVSGCQSGPVRTDAAAVSSSAYPHLASSAWWEQLHDPTLAKMVERALAQNFSIKAAALRLEESRSISSANRWALAPQTELGDTYQITHTFKYQQNGASATVFPDQLSGTNTRDFLVAWELPLFGKASGVHELSLAGTDRAYWELVAARVAVSSEIVRNYALWQGLSQNLYSFHTSDVLLGDLLALKRKSLQAGGTTRSEIDKLEVARRMLAQHLYETQSLRAQMAAKIAALVGDPSFVVPEHGDTLAVAPAVKSISANALRLRPDVRAAEDSVKLAAAQAKIARSELYPQFTLGGDVIFNTGTLDLYGGTRGVANVANVSAGLTIPLLNWFMLHAQAQAATTEFKATVMDYRQAVTSAWEEAQASYAQYAAAWAGEAAMHEQFALFEREAGRQRALVEHGLGTHAEVIQANLDLEISRRTLTDQQARSLEAWAKLIKTSFVAEDTSPAARP